MTSQPNAAFRPLRDTSGPDQVTGDAVVLDVPAAGIAMRLISGFIDLLCRMLVLIAALYGASRIFSDASDAVVAGITVILMACCMVLGPALIETLTLGRSVGKTIVGLRVVRTDGGAISFRHALVRAFIGYVEIFLTLGVVAFLVAMFTVRSRRLGDVAAGTYVVRETRKLRLPPTPQMPPQLAHWANIANVSPLPAGLARGLTTLARGSAGTTTEVYRSQVCRLLGQLVPYVSPPPPPRHDPLDVLNAIAVLRRNADTRVLAREDAIRKRLLHRT